MLGRLILKVMGRLENTVQARVFLTRMVVTGLSVFLVVAGTSFPVSAGPAPDFTLPNIEGKDVTLSKALAEGPVIIDFWATWCKPCIKAFPSLQGMYDKYRER